jgi:predicted Zn-dependent peptidase
MGGLVKVRRRCLMETVLMEVHGVNGQIQLLEDRIRISRKGFMGLMTQGLKGDKDILIAHISSIQFKKAGFFWNGYIQFAFLGGQESKSGLFDAVQDENTVVFDTGQQQSFDALKGAIEQKMAALREEPKPASNLDELEKLASLRDKGIITEEEFTAKKRRLLGL